MPELKTRRSIKIWQPAGFEGLELNKVRTDQLYGPRHVHETYQIGLILRGGGTFGYRGARVLRPPGASPSFRPEKLIAAIRTWQQVGRSASSM